MSPPRLIPDLITRHLPALAPLSARLQLEWDPDHQVLRFHRPVSARRIVSADPPDAAQRSAHLPRNPIEPPAAPVLGDAERPEATLEADSFITADNNCRSTGETVSRR